MVEPPPSEGGEATITAMSALDAVGQYVATRPQTVKSLCFSVIHRSVMLTHTVLEGFITE